jgi:signal peptidase I
MKVMEIMSVFLIGFFSCVLLFLISWSSDIEIPFGINGNLGAESPSNWIMEDDIVIKDDSIVLKISGASISRYSKTGSMKPVLDYETNGVRIKPDNVDQIQKGDIVTFRHEGLLVVHRVIFRGEDSFGAYFITRGDNNDFDDGRIRFEDIEWVTIALLY